MTKAIKNWFLEKQGFSIGSILELKRNGFEIQKETEKAVLIRYSIWDTKKSEMWIPKSCMIDEWETKFSPKAIGKQYHGYLVETAKVAYYEGNLGKQSTFTSGRNVYDGVSFIHQNTTADMMKILDYYNVKYMSKKEFAETLH